MGSVVLAVFSAAFGPFVYRGQIRQVIDRMFPFGRGILLLAASMMKCSNYKYPLSGPPRYSHGYNAERGSNYGWSFTPHCCERNWPSTSADRNPSPSARRDGSGSKNPLEIRS